MADDMSHRAPDARRMSFDEMAARAQYEWDRAEWAEAEARDMADRLESAEARVRELEAEVDALRHDLERQMTIANVECNRAERALAEAYEREANVEGGLTLLLAAVHADDPKREMLVRIGDLMRDAAASRAALEDEKLAADIGSHRASGRRHVFYWTRRGI